MKGRAHLSLASVFVCALTACHGQSMALVGDMTCPNVEYQCPSPAPSFSAQVQPIIDQHCNACHITGGAAPDRLLTTYAEVFKYWMPSFTAVYSCIMPPAADVVDQLSPSDRQTLLQWLACGAPNN